MLTIQTFELYCFYLPQQFRVFCAKRYTFPFLGQYILPSTFIYRHQSKGIYSYYFFFIFPCIWLGDGGGSNDAHALQTISNEAKEKKSIHVFLFMHAFSEQYDCHMMENYDI